MCHISFIQSFPCGIVRVSDPSCFSIIIVLPLPARRYLPFVPDDQIDIILVPSDIELHPSELVQRPLSYLNSEN